MRIALIRSILSSFELFVRFGLFINKLDKNATINCTILNKVRQLVGWTYLLCFFMFLDFTMNEEGKTSAGLKLLFFLGLTMFILGMGLARVVWTGRKEEPS
jgi:hypothetical protein